MVDVLCFSHKLKFFKKKRGKKETNFNMMVVIVDLFDRDKAGGISYHELTSVMYALGQNMTHQEVLDLFNEVDTDGNGEIDFEEFTKMMLKRQAAGKLMTEEEEVVRAFKLFDVDGNGTITADELRKMMQNLGSDLTAEEVELLIREADYDGNGVRFIFRIFSLGGKYVEYLS